MPRTRPSPRATEDAQRLVDLLNALGSTTFRQLLWQKASALDLTYAQSQVLFYVADHPECPMGEVAKAFGVTLPAVTHIVDRLEEKTLLTRVDHPDDRRVYLLDLTRSGRAVVRDMQATRLEAVEAVLHRMTARERSRIVGALEALVEAAAQVHEATS
jgi:DNA-binding MarR family transcriptional regulator